MRRIVGKLHMPSRAQLALWALKHGLSHVRA